MWRLMAVLMCVVLATGVAACGSDEGRRRGQGGGRREGARGQDRRAAPRYEVVGPLGEGRSALLRRGVQGRRPVELGLHDQERPGRSGESAHAGRAGDHRRGEGHRPHEPRLGQRRGDHRRRQVQGRDGGGLRPPHAQGRRGLLRLRRRDRGGPAAGQGSRGGSREGREGEAGGRDPRRRADRLVRDRPQERLQRGAGAEVRGRRVHEGRPAGGPPVGRPAGADDLRAAAAEERQQDRRRARRQRHDRQLDDRRAQGAQARRSPPRGSTRRPARSSISSPASSR